MNKKILIIGLLSFLVFGFNNEHSYGNTNEEFLTGIGYKSVNAALEEFEQHFNQQLKLPLRVPPISFTHQFARFSNLDGEMNDTFEVKFISDQFPENHFKIDVRPLQHKIDFSNKPIPKTFELNNKVTALYADNLVRGFNLFIFERDGWQYMFSIDKKVANTVTPEILVQIANSIDY
ncbi:hypothetical protein [Solibacillus sp. FSL K6-1523]|uniref:hypothetical protein n=1 Tax=Solibacillus sp. FSL K6-1523 TaxID=2921471 RepID=UPI0030F8215E